MTCASCAAHVEKALNQIDGVDALVNYATERATIYSLNELDESQLIQAVVQTGYSAESLQALPQNQQQQEQQQQQQLTAPRNRLLACSVLTVPVVAMAMIPALQVTNWQWWSLALATPVVFWGAYPFHRATWMNLRHGKATMDTLISIGTLSAYFWSLYELLANQAGVTGMDGMTGMTGMPEVYFEVATAVTVFLLAGRYFEARAKQRSGAALRALADLGARDVAVLRNGEELRIPIEELQVGEQFVVRPGEKLSTDGIVVEGRSAIDMSLLTGESIPVEVGPGDSVTGATLNAGGRLIVEATSVGSDTALAQISKLVEQAQSGKAPVQRLADRVAGVFVPVVLLIAVLTLAYWLLTGAGAETAFSAAVAVLIIACPCALGLATPTALLVGTGRGAQLGILIKGPEILESTRQIDTIVLDKTGTITSAKMVLLQVVAADSTDSDQVLRLIGALEAASEHPVGRAITSAALGKTGALLEVTEFWSEQGKGVTGQVDGQQVFAGTQALMAENAIELSAELIAAQDAAELLGRTAVLAAWGGVVRAVLVIGDTPRPSSSEAISRLQELGLVPVLLTGDNATAAQTVADQVGITQVISRVLPEQKFEKIKELQEQGKVVAMVGDGVNDAAALAQADLGIAMGSGTDVAIAASDLTLVRSDLNAVADALQLSRRTLRTIKVNLFWAFGYNVAAIPLAAAGLLDPMIAGAAMVLSSVFVLSNSLRLRRFTPAI
ncbi:MAG: heavy metal translocating P-type ATPase [Actinobacteria bacterium]|nr:heavy metal translocating P-type ATPase [Actinomycetota bacterium]